VRDDYARQFRVGNVLKIEQRRNVVRKERRAREMMCEETGVFALDVR